MKMLRILVICAAIAFIVGVGCFMAWNNTPTGALSDGLYVVGLAALIIMVGLFAIMGVLAAKKIGLPLPLPSDGLSNPAPVCKDGGIF
jgi:hypothetical protein